MMAPGSGRAFLFVMVPRLLMYNCCRPERHGCDRGNAMYTIFFAAFVLMALTVFSSTEPGDTDGVEAQPDAAANGLAKHTTSREYAGAALVVLGAGVVALVGLYLQNG